MTQLVKAEQDIVRSDNVFDMTPRSLSEAIQLAELIAKSTLIPPQYQNKPGDVLIAVQYGREIGLPPLQALQGIAVINGRPTVWGDAALAVVMASGLVENIKEMTQEEIISAQKAVCWIKRKGISEPFVREFSVEDAKRAKLWGRTNRDGSPGVWVLYWPRMLQMRARAWDLRDGFSDVLKGMAIREEIEDVEVADAPKVLAMPRRLSETPPSDIASPAAEPGEGAVLPPSSAPPQVTPENPPETMITPPSCETCGKVMELRPAGEKNGHSWPPYYRCPQYTKGSAHSVIKLPDWERMQRTPGQEG